jgi:hypothetical protein
MKYGLLLAAGCLIAASSPSCKKNAEVLIQKDTVLIQAPPDTVYIEAIRTDRYRGLLDIDCIFGGCYLGSYPFALTTVTYYSNDSTRFNIYSGSPGTSANFQYGFSIINGTDPGHFIESIDMKGLDSLRYFVHASITGGDTRTYDFRGVRR